MDIMTSCPIPLDLVDDPVTLHETGISFDVESLCDSLRRYPDLEPSTGQRFGRPLRFTENVAVLQILALVCREDDVESQSQNAIMPMPILVCPILLKVVHAPVVLHESESGTSSYDRMSLCTQLLLQQDRERFKDHRCEQPLHFAGSIAAPKLTALIRSESQLQGQDDTGFHEQYQVASIGGAAADGRHVLGRSSVSSTDEVVLVMVQESGMTDDRKSLCTQLLLLPDRKRFKNRRCEQPQHYTGSIAVRSIVALVCSGSQLRRHDDTGFHEQYQVARLGGAAVEGRNALGRPSVPSSIEVRRGDDDDGDGDGDDRQKSATRPDDGSTSSTNSSSSSSSQNTNPTQGNIQEARRQVPAVTTERPFCSFPYMTIALGVILVMCIFAYIAAP